MAQATREEGIERIGPIDLFGSGSRPGRARLSPLDAAFLFFERPNQPMHVGCLAELEGGIDLEAFIHQVEDRLAALGRYRQRPVRALLDVDLPAWEDDPEWDVRRHVHHLALPHPGDESALHRLVDQVFSHRLDPRHPLWSVHLIEGLPGGRAGMLWKMHHCMIDGVSGAQVLAIVTDPPPGVAATESAAKAVRHADRRAEPRGFLGRMAATLDLLRPGRVLERVRDVVDAAATIGGLVVEPNSSLPFNGPLCDRRRLAWASFGLEDVLAVRGAAGCKVNDVVLAIVAGALHRYLEARDVRTGSVRLRAIVPVNLRQDGNGHELGNFVSAMMPELPIGPMSAVERLQRVAAEMRSLKERGQVRVAGLLLSLAGALPPPLEAAFGRWAPSGPVANTVCTNVPGPIGERWLLGRRVLDVHPMVPLFQGMGLEFAVMSYAGRLSIAVTADASLVPDPEMIIACLRESAADLHESFRGRRVTSGAQEGLAPTRTEMEPPARSVGDGDSDGLANAAPAPSPGAPAGPSPRAETSGPRVANLMSSPAILVGSWESLLDAWRRMQAAGVRHLPVVDREGRLCGIVSHRDLLAAQASTLLPVAPGARVHGLRRGRVLEVMETHVAVARPDEPAAAVGERMRRHRFGCMPVVDGAGGILGVVTAGDFLDWATRKMSPAPSHSAAGRVESSMDAAQMAGANPWMELRWNERPKAP